MSLDGFIAKEDGDVAWLSEVPNPEQTDYGYADFYASIGTTVMGNETYRFIRNYGGPFPYPDCHNYVFTRNTALRDDEHVRYIHRDPVAFLAELKQKSDRDIWLVGGGQINTLAWNAKLIDRLELTVLPIVLGSGIPLLASRPESGALQLDAHRAYANGVVALSYKK